MKVLQVIDQLKVGGAERVVVDLSVLLKEQGVDIDFLSLLQPAALDVELHENKVQTHYLNRRNKYNPFTLFSLFSILNSYAIIHVHSRHVLRYIALTFLIPKWFRKYKVVFHDHYGTIETDASISAYLRKCITNCDAYIGVSEALVSWAQNNKLNHNIYLLENIVRNATRTKKISTESELLIVGNFREQKNYEFLIAVVESLPDFISVDIYGSIIEEAYYQHIKEKLAISGCSNRVNIITDESNTVSILSNYTMAIHTARSETGPLVAIEYMAKSIPFIMYNTGAVAKKLKQYDYDLIMDTFEVQEWKASITKVLQDQRYLSQLKAKIALIYKACFSEQNYVSTCKEVYQKTLHS